MRPGKTKILVIIVARIGDTLLVTPALKALKEKNPDSHLTVLAHPKRLELLRFLPFVDQLSGISKHSACWRGRIGDKAFDIAIVYGTEQALISYALRVAHNVYVFSQPELPDAPNLVATQRPVTALHAVYERLLLAEAAGARTSDFRLNYVVSANEQSEAKSWLVKRVPVGAYPLVGLQTLSFPTKAHRNWPLQSFAELIDKVLEHYPNAHFLALGDDAAKRHATSLAERFPNTLTIAAGTTSIRQSAALINFLDLYVGVDTGPTHLAGALGVPMVVMYHCAFPGRYLAPIGHPACLMIEHPLTSLTLEATPAMSDISVEQVWVAVHSLLTSIEKNRLTKNAHATN